MNQDNTTTEEDQQADVNQKAATEAPRRGQGFMGKPLIEKLKLVAVFAALAILIWFSHPTIQNFAIGGVLVLIGTLIRVWAGGHLTRDQRLTTSGPYQYSRNPFYLGRLLWIIGFAVMSGLGGNLSEVRNIIIWAILIAAIFIFFAYYMPRKEAREGGRLSKLFPDDYDRWKANVPSLFPRLTPYVMNPKPWDKDLYMGNSAEFMGNKEVWTTLAVVLLVALFYLRMVTLPS
jgi:protein-S-isoprenylcysteine O-methyltransferase Ste14